MADSRLNKRKRRKARKWVKTILSLILILILAVLCYGGYAFYQVYHAAKQSYTPIDRPNNKSALRKKAPTIGKDPISILMEGVENYSTGGKNGRADTLLVVTLNPHTKKMTIVSLNRDWRVKLPAKALPSGIDPNRYYKINASHAYGDISGYGANKLTVQTVEKVLGIPIDRYVAVDFQGFTKIVDKLGGVKIDVKYPFWEYDAIKHGHKIYFHKGIQTMNGEQALAFVRMRKRPIDVTYTRLDRERQFLKSAVKQAISAKMIFQINDISKILGKHVKTNLTPAEIYSLEQIYSSIDTSNIQTLDIKGQDKRIPAGTGLYYFVPDQQSLKKVTTELKKSLDLPVPSQTDNGSSQSSSTNSSTGTSSSTNGNSSSNGSSN